MDITIDRQFFIEQGAEITAKGIFAIENGEEDPSGKMVDGRYVMAPYLPMIQQKLGDTASRQMVITDAHGTEIVLTPEEEVAIKLLWEAKLLQLREKAINPTLTQEVLERNELHTHYFQRTKELMENALKDGVVIRLNMHTAIQKDAFGSADSVVVAPFADKGKTLIHPPPPMASNRYGG